jgi:hypothetical protein
MKKRERDAAKREIRRLIVEEGLSYRQCIERLKIPQRTFDRYIAEIFEHDNQALASKLSDDQIFTQFNICIERLTRQRQDILEQIANNEKADWKARVDAHHLASTIACVIAKLYVDAPALVAHRNRFPTSPLTDMPAARSNNTGVALRLKEIKDVTSGEIIKHERLLRKEEQEQELYDELDVDYEQQEEEAMTG